MALDFYQNLDLHSISALKNPLMHIVNSFSEFEATNKAVFGFNDSDKSPYIYDGTNWLRMASNFKRSGTNVYLDQPDSLGIGTSLPSTRFHVNGDIFTFTDGNEAVGKILGSDASGKANWIDPLSIQSLVDNFLISGTYDSTAELLTLKRNNNLNDVNIIIPRAKDTLESVSVNSTSAQSSIYQLSSLYPVIFKGQLSDIFSITDGNVSINNGSYARSLNIGGALPGISIQESGSETIAIYSTSTTSSVIEYATSISIIDSITSLGIYFKSGLLGIGVQNPSKKLSVSGGLNFSTGNEANRSLLMSNAIGDADWSALSSISLSELNNDLIYDKYDNWIISDSQNTGFVSSGDTIVFSGGTDISTSYSSVTNTMTISFTGSPTGISSAYSSITDGTIIASASGGDTIKFLSLDGTLSVSVVNNDPTHGDYVNYIINSVPWSKVTGTPTTLSGYGITDAYTKTELQVSGSSSVHWGNITNVPTFDNYVKWIASDGTSSLDIASLDTLNFVGAGGTNVSLDSLSRTFTISSVAYNFFRDIYVVSDVGMTWGSAPISADTSNDTLNFVAGAMMSIETDSTNDAIRISYTGGADDYVTSIGFDTSTGVLSLTRSSGAVVSKDLDGRYSELGYYIATINNNDSGYTWSSSGSAQATSKSDTLTFVGGANIGLDVDSSSKAIRISYIGGSSGLSNAYSSISDGVITASASGGDTIKFLSLDGTLSASVVSNDPTHGDYVNYIINSVPWSKVTSTPTTLSGYGITDAYTKTELQVSGSSSVHWGNITNVPTFDNYNGWVVSDGTNLETVLSGQSVIFAGGASISTSYDQLSNTLTISYTGSIGLTNAYSSISDGTTTASASGGDTIKFLSLDGTLSASVVSNDPTHGDYVNYIINSVPWSKVTSTPTTLSGYGITDAYTKTELQVSGSSSVHWGNITNVPTFDNYNGWVVSDGVSSETVLSGQNVIFAGGASISTSYDQLSNTLTISYTGSIGLTNAYSSITDGTVTASSSGSDTIRFFSGDSSVNVSVKDNDPTYGDAVDITVSLALNDLSNVNTVTPSDGDVLTYSAGTWISSAPSGGGATQNLFETFTIQNTEPGGMTWTTSGSVVADTATDTLTLVAGTGISLDVDTALDSIRISASSSSSAYADKNLSNLLSNTSIPVDLLPSLNQSKNIGSSSLEWSSIYSNQGYFSGQISGGIFTVNANSNSSFILDFNLGNTCNLNLSGNATVSFSNMRDGGEYTMIIKQAGSGSNNTITFPSGILWPGGVAPTLTTTLGNYDVISIKVGVGGIMFGVYSNNHM